MTTISVPVEIKRLAEFRAIQARRVQTICEGYTPVNMLAVAEELLSDDIAKCRELRSKIRTLRAAEEQRERAEVRDRIRFERQGGVLVGSV